GGKVGVGEAALGLGVRKTLMPLPPPLEAGAAGASGVAQAMSITDKRNNAIMSTANRRACRYIECSEGISRPHLYRAPSSVLAFWHTACFFPTQTGYPPP